MAEEGVRALRRCAAGGDRVVAHALVTRTCAASVCVHGGAAVVCRPTRGNAAASCDDPQGRIADSVELPNRRPQADWRPRLESNQRHQVWEACEHGPAGSAACAILLHIQGFCAGSVLGCAKAYRVVRVCLGGNMSAEERPTRHGRHSVTHGLLGASSARDHGPDRQDQVLQSHGLAARAAPGDRQ